MSTHKREKEGNGRTRTGVLAPILILGVALILASCITRGDSAESIENLEVAPLKGSIAPDFSLQDLSGNSVHLSDFHGEVVLINFWATWCPPCWQEMPTFQEYYTQYDTDFVVLAVDGDEPENAVRDFVAENGLTFPVVIDVGQKVTETYLVRSYPTSFIVDQDGVISKIHIGIMTHEQLDGYLAPLGIGQ